MASRTFVVTISDAPARVVIEDVRSRRRAVAADVEAVGAEIARWLEAAPNEDADRADESAPPR